jgi:hypothetical protein
MAGDGFVTIVSRTTGTAGGATSPAEQCASDTLNTSVDTTAKVIRRRLARISKRGDGSIT